ncbi:MAG TPA: TraR/DksA C4-type zinc finger protein, partial [Actinomycetes bacterium]|nr:TraR/DksA C4-type zinc finger protein [Actinomycetes bacterium]
MDQQTVDRLRERLEAERGEVRRQLDDLGARRDAEGIEDPELDEGFADAGQAAAERANLLTLVRSLRDTLHDVEQALGRMDAGTYGTCERCGQPIDEERLEAIPAVRLCMS